VLQTTTFLSLARQRGKRVWSHPDEMRSIRIG
jgi:hypothetical protein